MISSSVISIVGGFVAGVSVSVVAYFLGLRRSRLERLEDKRDGILAELSGLLFDVEDKFQKWYAPSLRSPQAGHTTREIQENKPAERGKAAIESFAALSRCYHRNAAWLDPDVAARIEGSIQELRKMLDKYRELGIGNTRFQVSTEGVEVAKVMDERIPKIRKELVDEFREILRPSTPGQRFLPESRRSADRSLRPKRPLWGPPFLWMDRWVQRRRRL